MLFLLLMLVQLGPSNSGELRVSVADPAGQPLQSHVELVSEVNQVRERLETDARGLLVAPGLPFGRYRMVVARDGFAPFVTSVDVSSALPMTVRVSLALAGVQAQVTVRPEEPLLDPHQTDSVSRIGADMLRQRVAALPGRSLADLVNTQPGWLLEANGILHPRGSEYQTQFVVDGLPITDNRSPAFAPEIDADEVSAMSVLTGGYPAEYGRKLGGVVEVATSEQARRGLHGAATATVGSFATRGVDASLGYGWDRANVTMSASLAEPIATLILRSKRTSPTAERRHILPCTPSATSAMRIGPARFCGTAARGSTCRTNTCSRLRVNVRIEVLMKRPRSSPTSTSSRRFFSATFAAWFAICRRTSARMHRPRRSSLRKLVDFRSCT